jgi:hypothetical protein
MNTWILILMMHVGAFGDGNSNALTSVSGFNSRASCETAGRNAAAMAQGTVKEIKFVCASAQ